MSIQWSETRQYRIRLHGGMERIAWRHPLPLFPPVPALHEPAAAYAVGNPPKPHKTAQKPKRRRGTRRKRAFAAEFTPGEARMVRRPSGYIHRVAAGTAAAEEPPIAYREQPVAQPSFETHVQVPLAIAGTVAGVVGGATFFYTQSAGWSVGTAVVVFLPTFLWRIGASDKTLRMIEEFLGVDLDNDGIVGFRDVPVNGRWGEGTIQVPERDGKIRPEQWQSFAVAVLRDGCRISQNAICGHTADFDLVKVSQPQYLLMYNDLKKRGYLDEDQKITFNGARYLWERAGEWQESLPYPTQGG